MSTTAMKRKSGSGPLRAVKKPKRFKRQAQYHSSSESDGDDDANVPEFAPISMEDSDDDVGKVPLQTNGLDLPVNEPSTALHEDLSGVEDDDAEVGGAKKDEFDEDELELEDESMVDDDTAASDLSGSEADSQAAGKKRKRNDPTAFANSMSKILSSKLSTSKRADPVLSRSAAASTANKELTDSRLETKAKQKMRAERRAALERGRVKDVLGLETDGISTAHVQERERRLKKTAQRGVVKLFNAVRAAQVQAETAREQARKEGVVGMRQREEKINEMSKQGFLDLIAKGGKKSATIEEG